MRIKINIFGNNGFFFVKFFYKIFDSFFVKRFIFLFYEVLEF